MGKKRLSSILEYISLRSKVADIGSDHGFIPIELAKRGYPCPIATEVLPGPFKQCAANLARFGVNVDLRFGSGLVPIRPGEVDIVVIAGMSGQTIAHILSESWSKVGSFDQYIFQPMLGSGCLRKFLFEKNLGMIKEWVIYERNTFYQYIAVIPQRIGIPPALHEAYSTIDSEFLLEVGPRLLLNRDHITHQFLRSQECKQNHVLKRINKTTHPKRYHEVCIVLDQWKQVVDCHMKLLDSCK